MPEMMQEFQPGSLVSMRGQQNVVVLTRFGSVHPREPPSADWMRKRLWYSNILKMASSFGTPKPEGVAAKFCRLQDAARCVP